MIRSVECKEGDASNETTYNIPDRFGLQFMQRRAESEAQKQMSGPGPDCSPADAGRWAVKSMSLLSREQTNQLN
jgi:hypothetical protein